MVKVCHITSVHPPEDVRIFKKECTSLAKYGYDVYLVQQGDSYEKNGVHIVGFGEKSGGRIKRMTKYARKAYNIALDIDADLYHIHDPELLPYGLLLHYKGKKVIFDSHEHYALQIRLKKCIPKLLRNLVANLYHEIETFICKRISGVVKCGNVDGKDIFEGRAKRCVDIFNYPVLEDFFPDDTFIKNEEYFCYFGSLTEDRGITELVKVSYRLKLKLFLAGTFPDIEYKNLLMAMNEFEYTKYLGIIDHSEVRKLMSSAFCGVNILHNVGQYAIMETMPIKVFEYMACGIPVVLNNNKFNTEFVKKHNVGMVVDPQNIDEIAKAILFFKNNKNEGEKMGLIGRRIVVENYSWQLQEKKLVNFYGEILKAGCN